MMNRILHVFSVSILVLILGGCATTVPTGTRSTAARYSEASSPEIKTSIDALLPDSLFPPASVGVRIVGVQTGKLLYELNPRLLFTPASNQKLLTSAGALAELGPGFQFETTVRIDSAAEPIITITGSGDPLIGTADIDTITQVLARLLPVRAGWTLAGDVSAFDDLPWGRGWMWDDEPDPTAMEISPLSVNRNCIAVHVRPGSTVGETLLVSVDPPTEGVSVQNNGITIADSVRRPLNVTRMLREKGNVILVGGEMKVGDSAATRRISVSDPGRYFLSLLAERLRLYGVPVTRLLLDTLPATGPAVVVRTRTLDSVVTFMNTWSDNLSAECILKTMGARSSGGRGSAGAGVRVLRSALAQLGVDTTAVVCADGSGLSRYNLVSARVLSDLLVRVARDTILFPVMWQSLPVAGKPGTLQKRMRGSGLAGNVRAKTGTMTGGSSLSGYVRTAGGELLAFAILMQNYPGEAAPYRAVQDRLCQYLASLGH